MPKKVSTLQLVANQRNAQRSTGPQTAEGKAAVSQNAASHGLFSAKLILGDETPFDFQQLMDSLVNDLKPVGVPGAVAGGESRRYVVAAAAADRC